MKKYTSLSALAMTVVLANLGWAQGTATLKMKVVVNGSAPKPSPINSKADPFCAMKELQTDKILVGSSNELINFVVMFDEKTSKTEVPESVRENKPATVELDNRDCMFSPKVLVARPGQTIKVKNSDQTGHNANFKMMENEQKNLLVPAGESLDYVLDPAKVEPAPIPIECNVHPWMQAYVIVKPHPYVGVSGKDGVIEIKDLPPGKVTFRVWHEGCKSISGLNVGGKDQKLSRNRWEIDLKPGDNDLGVVKLDSKAFEK